MVDRVTQALVEARKQAGLTQKQLAEHLGVAQATLADVERGRRPLPRERIAKLPKEIRRRVIDAALDELRRQTAELRELRRQP
jgi:transcriptional regulator with XRE-family HTH domain